MGSKYFEDSRGNKSSLRVLVAVFIVIEILLLLIWGAVFLYDALKGERSDYVGLAAILTAILGSGVASFAFKAYQKKYE